MNKIKSLTKEQKEKIKIALELLCEDCTNLGKFQKITSLIKGYDKKVDEKIEIISKVIGKIQQIQGGDVITLTAEKLPETTKKQKDRKKLLLLLWSNWNGLKSEVNRISSLQDPVVEVDKLKEVNKAKMVKTGKIAATLKGPLGALTIAAAGIVAINTFLNSKSVNISVKNIGCGPIGPFSQNAISLPGLKVPNNAISSGSEGTVTLPGINFTVNMKQTGSVSLSTKGLSKSFNIPSQYKEIIFDGEVLTGKETIVKLSKSKNHELIIKCE